MSILTSSSRTTMNFVARNGPCHCNERARPAPCRNPPSRCAAEGPLGDAQVHLLEAPCAGMRDRCVSSARPAPLPRARGVTYPPDHRLVTFFHFGRAHELRSCRRGRRRRTVRKSPGLREFVEDRSNGFGHERHVVFDGRPERQRLGLQRFATKRDEGIGVCRDQAPDAARHGRLPPPAACPPRSRPASTSRSRPG